MRATKKKKEKKKEEEKRKHTKNTRFMASRVRLLQDAPQSRPLFFGA
jgi:hypothetical protein